jgi:hypothetical protein
MDDAAVGGDASGGDGVQEPAEGGGETDEFSWLSAAGKYLAVIPAAMILVAISRVSGASGSASEEDKEEPPPAYDVQPATDAMSFNFESAAPALETAAVQPYFNDGVSAVITVSVPAFEEGWGRFEEQLPTSPLGAPSFDGFRSASETVQGGKW